ncbi:LOW QUALITY PROTEIN: VQ motif-containing protein 9-like [Pyrus x bretschneideri]|uniref:LOW QUALITY PROTEIN: VQ motif-containing protein 9-like n=1 Tax=Pyrus x bretschneideri TaxID=225117 RepID=UPI00202DC819|nr:LOW QUALITY PROTEIN: VQ motif-containing protein 9-like [Pyrus x bretschneideri]
MDKICPSSTTDSAALTTAASSGGGGSSTTTTTTENYLKHLNKLSHKISKPPTTTNTHNTFLKKPNFENSPPPPPPLPLPPQHQQQQQHQHQPPVYNINKNDFRDVVQKLTGSPAHDRFSNPQPPVHLPKPQISSRLQRIRPPPLAQLNNRPPPSLECAAPPQNTNNPIIPPMGSAAAHFNSIGRSTTPLSPLPPFPTVHAAAESPVSAYMRYLHNSISAVDSNNQKFSGFSPLAPLVSPRWTNLTPPPQQNQQVVPPQQGIGTAANQQQQTTAAIASQPQFAMPPSPLPFGCLSSPRSPYPSLSPNQLGFPQLPLSPTVPVSSPRWRSF